MRNPLTSISTGKTTPCCSKVGIKRGPWTPEEDEILANYVNKEGGGRWRTLPKRAGLLRCGKSCRLRWMNYLRPSVKRGKIAPDEEDLILRLHRLLGNRWSLIAGRIPGRTDNEIKNYWNTHLSKKLISQGIDPRTHKPLLNPSCPDIAVSASNTKQNPKSPGISETGYDPAIATVSDLQLPIVQKWQDFDGAIMMNEQQYCLDSDNHEDHVLSSFLETLMNEDAYQNQQLPAHNLAAPSLPSLFSSIPSFNNGDIIWEAEFRASTET